MLSTALDAWMEEGLEGGTEEEMCRYSALRGSVRQTLHCIGDKFHNNVW